MRPSLYFPVKPFHINQPFGYNLPCVKDFGLPTQEIVTGVDNLTCPIGYDKLYQHWGMAGHNGIDLQAGEQNVYAAADGVVVEKQTVPSHGLGLGILSNLPVDLGTNGIHYLKLRYWHLKMFFVEVGDIVKAGDLIGVTDNTGYSSGNHLHFEGQLMDKDFGGHPINIQTDNGYFGAIDIFPYFNGQFAEDLAPIGVTLRSALVKVLMKLIAIMLPKV